MLYYDTRQGKRQSAGEVARRGVESGSMYECGIVTLEQGLPKEYDPELHNIADVGDEEFTEERTRVDPNGEEAVFIASGWRIKWALAPKPLGELLPVLLARLSAKKHAVEDGGITLPNGVTIDSAETDRNRVMSLKLAYMVDPDDPALAGLEFKTPAGFVPVTKADIDGIYAALKAHTLAVFKREAEIRALLEAADTPEELLAVFSEEINEGWPVQTA